MYERSDIFTYSPTPIFLFFFFYYYSHPSGCKFGIRDLIFPNPLLGFALAYAILILFLPIFVHFIYALSDLIAITYYKLP